MTRKERPLNLFQGTFASEKIIGFQNKSILLVLHSSVEHLNIANEAGMGNWLAQSIEHRTLSLEVMSSSPTFT